MYHMSNLLSAPWGVGNTSDVARVFSKSEIMEIHRKKLSESREYGNTYFPVFFGNKFFTEEDVIELLQIYFGHEVDSNIKSKNEEAILYMAVAKKRRHVVEFLLEKFKGTIDKNDKNGNSIAHLLVNGEKERFFQFLTYDHVQSRKSDDEIEQIENESASFVEWLMEKGVDFDRENQEGKTALHLSIENNLQHISRLLLKYTQNIHQYLDQHNQSLLHLFLEKNAKYRNRSRGNAFKQSRYSAYTSRYAAKCVQMLLDKGVSSLAYNYWEQTPLYMAVKEKEDTSIAEMMISRLLEKNHFAKTTFVELLKSCSWWHVSRAEYFLNILRELVTTGTDVDAKGVNGTTPVYWAFAGKNRDAVAFLGDYGADFGVLTENNENLLHALAKKLDPSVEPDDHTQEVLFELLLKKGCTDVNAKTRSSEDTPLHFASESGYLAIVRKLIEHGAEVDCKNTSGETPLHLAVHSNSSKVAGVLLTSGADVNSEDESGRWPLYHASTSKQSLLLVPLLLQWGAYVNAQIAGESPFCRAIRGDCFHNAREMLAYGADIDDDRVLSLLPSSNNNCSELQILLMQHWVKLDTAKLPASKKYADIVKFKDHQKFYDECLKEVEKMKDTFIGNRTSVYAFLHMDFARRRYLINDENLKILINSPELGTQFPKYAVIILATYRETVLWRWLLEPAERGWLKRTGIRLPSECLEPIFAHLRNVDLLGMIEYGENA